MEEFGTSSSISLLPAPPYARSGRRLFSSVERQAMLTQIARVALAIGRDLSPERGLQDADTTEGRAEMSLPQAERLWISPTKQEADACPRERLAFLQAVLPRIEAALSRLEAAPPCELRPQAEMLPLARARRVRPKDLMQALATASSKNEPQVRQFRPIPDHDLMVNRWVKGVLVAWVRDVSALSALAVAVGAADVARDARRLRRRLRLHLVRSPWQALLPESPLPTRIAASAWQNPSLRLLRDTFQQYRRSFCFDWATPLFHLPERDTWLLYEQWCLFQTAQALRQLGYTVSDASDFRMTRGGLTFSLVKGRASQLRFVDTAGRTVSLYYSRPFERGRADREGLLSRSHQMRPDIVLEAGGHLLILDAKLKAYAEPEQPGEINTPLTDDLNQCHAYRDGIRWKGGRRAVTGAWLLYAGRTGANRSVIAYPEARSDAPLGAGEIGAVLLRPASGVVVGQSHLGALLELFFRTAFR